MSQEVAPTIEQMQYIEMAHSVPYFNRNYFMKATEAYQFAYQHENTGIYRSAFRYQHNNKELNKDGYLFADFYMDFDKEGELEAAREDLMHVVWTMSQPLSYKLPPEAFRVYFSGKKGFHLIIPYLYLGIKPAKGLDELFRWIATGFYQESMHETIDLVVYESRRMWRLENSIHQETGLYKIPLELKEAQHLSIEEIQELAKSPRMIKYPKPYFVPSANKEYLREARRMIEYKQEEYERFKNYKPQRQFSEDNIPEYVQQLIDEGPIKNYRNETIAALTSFYMQLGYSEEDILDIMLDWNQGSVPSREVKTTVHSVYYNKYIYSKRRLKALAEKDMSLLVKDLPKVKETPPWKRDIAKGEG